MPHGTCADGEPQRPGRGCDNHDRYRDGGARSGHRDGRGSPDGERITLGGDKAYDTRDFVAEMRRLGVTPHVSQNTKGRRSAIDGRTTRHAGHAISVRIRKRIEEVFGWIKTVGGLRKTRHRGTARVGWMFTFVATAYNACAHPEAAGWRGVVMPGLCPHP